MNTRIILGSECPNCLVSVDLWYSQLVKLCKAEEIGREVGEKVKDLKPFQEF